MGTATQGGRQSGSGRPLQGAGHGSRATRLPSPRLVLFLGLSLSCSTAQAEKLSPPLRRLAPAATPARAQKPPNPESGQQTPIARRTRVTPPAPPIRHQRPASTHGEGRRSARGRRPQDGGDRRRGARARVGHRGDRVQALPRPPPRRRRPQDRPRPGGGPRLGRGRGVGGEGARARGAVRAAGPRRRGGEGRGEGGRAGGEGGGGRRRQGRVKGISSLSGPPSE